MCSVAIFTRMFRSRWLLGGLGAMAALSPAGALAATAPSTSTTPTPSAHALLSSRELWATIDVCNPADQPDTVGIRGSMPGDGSSRDALYMRFVAQYRNGSRWTDLGKGASTGYGSVGGGGSHSRQGGTSFVIAPVAGHPAFMLRGIVEFQWRRGGTVIASAARATSAGRRSLAGADPTGFSAAGCSIG